MLCGIYSIILISMSSELSAFGFNGGVACEGMCMGAGTVPVPGDHCTFCFCCTGPVYAACVLLLRLSPAPEQQPHARCYSIVAASHALQPPLNCHHATARNSHCHHQCAFVAFWVTLMPFPVITGAGQDPDAQLPVHRPAGHCWLLWPEGSWLLHTGCGRASFS